MTHVLTFSKKAFTWAVVATTILWSIGIFGVVSVAQAADISSGDLIKASGAAVYYYGSDGKRYVFPNEKTYNTWFADFSSVKTVTDAELAAIMIGGNATYRPGVKMVKITTDPKVYAVGMDGTLRWVESEAVAVALYGANWNTMIDDVPDAFFVNYTVGSSVANATEFDKDAVTAGSPTINVDKGLSASATGGGLTVAIASDTPAAGLIVGGAARVPFTKVNLTASSEADVVIDSLTVERGGISLNTDFSSIVLIDGNTDLQLGNEKTLNSSSQAVFSDDITVPAGTTMPLIVAGNMAAVGTITAGDVATLAISAINTTADVSGALPITGNVQTLNGTLTIGAVTITAGGLNPSAATKEIGTEDYIFSSIQMANNSVEVMHITRIIWDQNGTVSDSDVANLELVMDGAVLATVANASNKKVNFDLSASPIVLGKGLNKEASIRGDIMDGSGRTIDFDVRKNIDIVAQGQTYGYNVTPTFTGVSSEPYFSGNIATISGGSLTVGKANLASTNVAEGATQQEIGAFTLQGEGEIVDITSLVLGVVVTGTGNEADVTNLTIYDANGAVVGGPVDPSNANNQATTTDTIAVPVGVNTYTVKADLNSDFAASDTIVVTAQGGQWTARGSITNNTVTPTPSSVALDTVTVKVGALAITNRNVPAAQNILVGQQDFEFLSFTLDATASGEDLRFQQLIFNMNGSGTTADITGITVMDGSTALNVPDSGAAAVTTDLITPLVVTKGTSKTLSLQGDITGAGTAGETYRFTVSSSTAATGVETSSTISETHAGNGQVMTIIASGGLSVDTDASNPQATLFAVGDTTGSMGVTIGEVRMTATTGESVLLDSVNFTTSANINNSVGTMYLYDGTTLVGTAVPTTSAAVYMEIVDGTTVPKGTAGKKFTVKADLLAISDASPSAAADDISVSLTVADVLGKGQASNATVSNLGTMTGNTHYVFRSVPTVAKGSLSTQTLVDGTIELYRWTVSADSAGDIGLANFTFNVATSSTVALTNFIVTDETDDTQLNNTAVASIAATELEVTFNPGGGGIVERQVSAGTTRTYVLKATATGAASGDSVQVSLVGDSAALSATKETVANARDDAQDDFVWTDRTGVSGSHGTTTADWVSGYRVNGLPSSNTSPEVLSKA